MARPAPAPFASEPSRPALLTLCPGLIAASRIAEAVATLEDMLVGLGAPRAGDLDAKVSALLPTNRSALSAAYDAFRETLIFRQIISDEALIARAKEILGADTLHSPFQHAVFRMDFAGEHWRGFGWHQDTAYNMLSADYLTAWLPLTPTGPGNGSIQVARAASDQVLPIAIRYKRDGQGKRLTTRDAFISDEHQASLDAEAETLTLMPSDVALFHNRLIHRSGFNPGLRHRFSIQVRFGDLMDADCVERGWKNRRADGFDTFKALYPDLVAFEETA